MASLALPSGKVGGASHHACVASSIAFSSASSSAMRLSRVSTSASSSFVCRIYPAIVSSFASRKDSSHAIRAAMRLTSSVSSSSMAKASRSSVVSVIVYLASLLHAVTP
jgi:hypothetical protein